MRYPHCLLVLSCLACGTVEPTTTAPGGVDEPRPQVPVARLIGKSDGQCGPFPAWYLPFLDDTACQKRLPTNQDRDFACPLRADAAGAFLPASEGGVVEPLDGVVPDDVRLTLIVIKRVDGVPHYRYFGHQADVVVQPWSTTKFMAAANAAARLRIASDYAVGLTARAGSAPLGDLVTALHAYDEARFTSNGLARWFHDVGGRDRALALVTDWLGRPGETFGGNYGAPSAAIPLAFDDAGAALTLTPDQTPPPANQLSTWTLAEFLKRLVMHREDASTRLPGIQWADLRVLFHGAQPSAWYGPEVPQGMQADTAIYLQQAVDLDRLEAESDGRWRIYSKLGAGSSRGGEIAHVGYACLPFADQPVELVIAAHMSVGGAWGSADRRLAELYSTLVGMARRL